MRLPLRTTLFAFARLSAPTTWAPRAPEPRPYDSDAGVPVETPPYPKKMTRATPKGPVVSLAGPFRNDIDGKFQRTIKDQKPSRAERPLVLEAL